MLGEDAAGLFTSTRSRLESNEDRIGSATEYCSRLPKRQGSGLLPMGVNLIGWLSSLVLLLTLGQQVRQQWTSRESRGVSTWLFIGQLAASSGFAVYSYLVGNWVFLSTNLLLVANAAMGEWVTLRNRRRHGRSATA
jgi:uncharacterized protein with PQ loop repeat